jgi:hypothetical protein
VSLRSSPNRSSQARLAPGVWCVPAANCRSSHRCLRPPQTTHSTAPHARENRLLSTQPTPPPSAPIQLHPPLLALPRPRAPHSSPPTPRAPRSHVGAPVTNPRFRGLNATTRLDVERQVVNGQQGEAPQPSSCAAHHTAHPAACGESRAVCCMSRKWSVWRVLYSNACNVRSFSAELCRLLPILVESAAPVNVLFPHGLQRAPAPTPTPTPTPT